MSLQKHSKRFYFSDNGWCEGDANCRVSKSPNFDSRPKGTEIDLLVLHNISVPEGIFGGRELKIYF